MCPKTKQRTIIEVPKQLLKVLSLAQVEAVFQVSPSITTLKEVPQQYLTVKAQQESLMSYSYIHVCCIRATDPRQLELPKVFE